MLKFNEMPDSSELKGKLKQFASNACVSEAELDDLDINQLQQLADMYDKVRLKDILIQSLDSFFEGIKNHYISTDDALYDILGMICEANDLGERLLLKELYHFFKDLGTESGDKMLALRDLVTYPGFDEKAGELQKRIFSDERKRG